MDRRQFDEAVEFFTRARHYYESLGDALVAEECGFAIALAQRVLGDAERGDKQPSHRAPEVESAPCSTAKDSEMNAA